MRMLIGVIFAGYKAAAFREYQIHGTLRFELHCLLYETFIIIFSLVIDWFIIILFFL